MSHLAASRILLVLLLAAGAACQELRREALTVDGSPQAGSDAGGDAPPASLDSGAPDSPADSPAPNDGPRAEATPDMGPAVGAVWVTERMPARTLGARVTSSAVAVDPLRGQVQVVWAEAGAILTRRWDPGGRTWGATRVIDDRAAFETPVVTFDHNGKVLVAYHNQVNSPQVALHGVWVSQASDGLSWSPPVRLTTSDSSGHMSLAAARNGQARLAFTTFRRDNGVNTTEVTSAHYDGTSWGQPAVLYPQIPNDSLARDDATTPRVAIDPGGAGVVAWTQTNPMTRRPVALAVRFQGATVQAARELDPERTALPSSLGVRAAHPAINAQGRGLIGWCEVVSSQRSDLRVVSFDAAGIFGPALTGAGNCSDLVVPAIDADGNETLVFDVPGDTGRNVAAVRRPRAQGFGAAVPLETDNLLRGSPLTEGDYPEHTAVTDSAGSVHVFWIKKTGPETRRIATRPVSPAGDWGPQQLLGPDKPLTSGVLTAGASDSGLVALSFAVYDGVAASDEDLHRVFVSILLPGSGQGAAE